MNSPRLNAWASLRATRAYRDNVCGYWYGEDCTLTTCPVRDYIRWKQTRYDKHTCQECANFKENNCVYTDETGKQTCCVTDRKEACTYFRPL